MSKTNGRRPARTMAAIDQRLDEFQQRPTTAQNLERRLEYFNRLNMIYSAHKERNKFELRHVPSLEACATEFIDLCEAAGEQVMFTDYAAYVQKDLDVGREYFEQYCAEIRDLREMSPDG